MYAYRTTVWIPPNHHVHFEVSSEVPEGGADVILIMQDRKEVTPRRAELRAWLEALRNMAGPVSEIPLDALRQEHLYESKTP